MRYSLALACCVTLTAGDLAQLRQLEERHRMFELRAALDQLDGNSADTLLYRAITTSRFGGERESIGQFHAFLATKPAREMERKARTELSLALTRLGEYGQAASEAAAVWRLTAEGDKGRPEIENGRGLMECLRDVAPQTVELGPPAPVQARRNQFRLWEVPVEINSQRSEWILDTGANFSTVSESEARHMGLAIREVEGYARGYTGAKNPTRVAVVGELRLGSARLHNVVLLVMADESLFVQPLKYQIHGILGLPAMRSLGCVELSAEGMLTLDGSGAALKAPPNFFFDGLNLIVQVVHSGHDLQMMVDTGVPVTSLYPSSRDALAKWERDHLTSAGTAGYAGAGGSVQIEADLVPNIQLEVLGRAVNLQGIMLLHEAPAGAELRDGILGVDALSGGFRLDFRGMHFMVK